MKDTISEYARILVVLASFAMIMMFLFGGRWFTQLGKASAPIGNKISTQKQDEVLNAMTERENPKLYVSGATINVGQLTSLYSLIPDTHEGGYAVQDADGKNLKDYVEIFCDSKDYDEETGVLIPSHKGVYKVFYTVQDSYGLSTEKTINIVVI